MQEAPATGGAPGSTLNLRRMAGTTAWALGAAAVIGVLWISAQAPHADYFDAQVQLGAVRDLVRGNDPYSKYVQSPLWTYLFLLPFGFLPVDLSYPAQFAVNIGLWCAANVLLLRAAGVPWGPGRTAIAAGLLIIFAPVIWSTRGQVNGYNALGLGLFLVLLPHRPAWAGAALVLLLAKPHIGFVTLAMLGGWLLLTARWRALAGAAAAFGGLTALSLVLRPQWPVQWLTALTHPLPEVVAGRARFAPTVGYFLGRWLPVEAATAMGAATATLTTATLTFWLLRARNRITAVELVAISGPAVFLITPYSQGYDVSNIIPTLALLAGAQFRVAGRARWCLVTLGALVYIFPWAMVRMDWPQATLLVPAAVCLALAVAFRPALTPPTPEPIPSPPVGEG